MRIKLIRYLLALPAILSASCAEESLSKNTKTDTACIMLTVDSGDSVRSSLLADENHIGDLNVWIYSSSGQLKETFYLENLSIASVGSVNISTAAGGHSNLVVIANAGRALAAPSQSSESVQIPMSYANDASAMMLMVGAGTLSLTSTGMRSSVILHRVMSRIALTVRLNPSLSAAGGVLGGNVRIARAGLFNSPSVLTMLPAAAWESARTSCAVQGTPVSSGDCLSASDIATLCSGGTVYLYCLPNYTDLPYTDSPTADSRYSSYIEIMLEFDGIGDVGEGRVACRFYANDGDYIGLKGGCSYTCQVIISNDGASNSWRKDDFRMDAPDTFFAGEIREVLMHSRNHDSQSVSFSLSDNPGVLENEVFKLGDKVVTESLQGIRIISKTAGNGMLYCFNSAEELMGSVPLTAVFPEISVPDKTLDVIGTESHLGLQGLSDIYAHRASDELFNSLYSVASVEPQGSVDGLYGQDFIYSGPSDGLLYVNELSWTRAGVARDWTETVGKTFPYKATLACGISADFNVIISNGLMGPLEGNVYFGEAFDTRQVEDPLPAVAALNNQNTIVAEISSGIPKEFCKTRVEREADGWRTWFGGTRLVDGHDADAYITAYGLYQIRWDLPSTAVRMQYGAAVPIFVGKMNPHCNEYVKAKVGYYASTCYYPVGIEAMIEVLNEGHVVTCLCFRPHDSSTVLDITHGHFAYQGWDGGSLFSGYTGIGAFGYAASSDGSYLETNWDGDLTQKLEFDPVNGSFFDSSQYIYSVAQPYNGSSFGARSGRHLAIYYYSPYSCFGSPAAVADENGHVNAKGYVSVEKWSVSSRSYFDWDDSRSMRLSSAGL